MTVVIAEVSVGLCGLETSRYPHTVRRKGVADRVPFASEARVRGSPR
jgi:hypothetical protein